MKRLRFEEALSARKSSILYNNIIWSLISTHLMDFTNRCLGYDFCFPYALILAGMLHVICGWIS